MIKAIKTYLSVCGRKGGQASNPRKGFGNSEVRAKAAATRSANRARDSKADMQEAVYKSTARRGE